MFENGYPGRRSPKLGVGRRSALPRQQSTHCRRPSSHKSWWTRFEADNYLPTALDSLDYRVKRPYLRLVTADADGHFTFKGLKPQEYIVFASLTWMAGTRQQGGKASAIVTAALEPEQVSLIP